MKHFTVKDRGFDRHGFDKYKKDKDMSKSMPVKPNDKKDGLETILSLTAYPLFDIMFSMMINTIEWFEKRFK